MRKFALPWLALALVSYAHAQGGSMGVDNPFSAPDATVHYAPSRTFDLLDVSYSFDVDYPNRKFSAVAVNTATALLSGTTQHRLNASRRLSIDSVEFNGRPAKYSRDDEGILIETPPTKAGEKLVFRIAYHSQKTAGQQGGGWHWHEPIKSDPSKVGFFTNGETADTRDWCVTWDYPNDFATSETRTTVRKDWSVIGNGLPISDTPTADGKRHTVVWRMNQPHATYLTSIVAGPFDIHKDTWRGITLYYVCPKGMGGKLDYSFAHTKDILSFYSDKLGVKYPWPKYAQDCTYDFGGGQENVSATTYGIFLTDSREDRYGMDWLISHETGHQWFGDLVTCKDWGQIWLNESFAEFMEMSWTRQSRGPVEASREVESESQGYFQESRRYKRPMATNFYQNPDVMFDQHTYPKGGVLLTSLRMQLGDEAFYAGLHRYLTQKRGGPVESNDLCEAMTEASGINLHPWFDQWIYKPGHPVIDWSWSWDDAKKEVVVKVKQTQDTSKGTPIYDVPTHVGLLAGNSITRFPIHLSAAEQEFRLPSSNKPESVAFDPDHEFLREIPKMPWAPEELMAVLRADPNPIDRAYALRKLLTGTPSDSTIHDIVDVLKADQGPWPAIQDTGRLGNLKRPDLRSFWEAELRHESYARRAGAARALANLPDSSGMLRTLIDDHQPYAVVEAALRGLSDQDFAGSKTLILSQARSMRGTIRSVALTALVKADAPEAREAIFDSLAERQPLEIQQAGMGGLGRWKGDDPRLVPTLRRLLHGDDFTLAFSAAQVAGDRKIKDLVPDLENAKKTFTFRSSFFDDQIKKISG